MSVLSEIKNPSLQPYWRNARNMPWLRVMRPDTYLLPLALECGGRPLHDDGQSSTGNPKLADVRRREDSVYVWIRTEGSEGWEVVVSRFELVEA